MCVAIIGEISVNTARGEGTNTSSNENITAAAYWKPVEKAMGEDGNISSDGAIKFTIPVTLNVTLNDIPLNPASESSHDFDFMRAGDKATMVGEIGVTEKEAGNVSEWLFSHALVTGEFTLEMREALDETNNSI